jgi:Zn-finger protein
MNNSYTFFQNTSCKFYPCHSIESINCLFCYCPLFTFKFCGGNFRYTKSGKKDCTHCNLPHQNYDYVVNFLVVDSEVSSSRNNQQHRSLTSFK